MVNLAGINFAEVDLSIVTLANNNSPDQPIQTECTITASCSAGGSISPLGSTVVEKGSNQTYTISVNEGYLISSIHIDGNSVDIADTYIFTDVQTNHSIAVTFRKLTFTFTINPTPVNAIVKINSITTNTATVEYGSTVTYEVSKTGYTSATGSQVVTDDVSLEISLSITSYVITSHASAGGSIDPTGDTTITYGSDAAYTITPDSGYHIYEILVDNVSVDIASSYTFSNVTSDHTISVSFAETVSSYTITSSNNSADNYGTIDPLGVTTVDGGSSKVYTITPSDGYSISDVLVDGVSQGVITTYTFSNISTNHTISVTFTAKLLTVTYNTASNGSFTVSSRGSSVSSGSTVNYGSNLLIIATANTHCRVHSILVNSVEVMSSGAQDNTSSYSYSISSVTENIIISVSFIIKQYTITSSTGSNGTIDPLGATAVNEGSSQTYTITPNSNYQVADVLTDGTSRGSITTYTFTNVTAAHTISVTFSETPTDPVILSSTVNPNVYNVFLNGTNTTTTHPNNKDFISATYGVDVTDSITVSEAAKIKTFDFNSDSLPIFKGNTSITTFNELKYFTAMTNYQSVPELCAKAFYNCTALTAVTLPATITNLRAQVFEKCSAMKTITFLETAPPVTEVYTFGRYDLMGAGVSSGKQIIIPAGCTAAYTASTVSGGTTNYIKTVLIDTCGYTLVEAS